MLTSNDPSSSPLYFLCIHPQLLWDYPHHAFPPPPPLSHACFPMCALKLVYIILLKSYYLLETMFRKKDAWWSGQVALLMVLTFLFTIVHAQDANQQSLVDKVNLMRSEGPAQRGFQKLVSWCSHFFPLTVSHNCLSLSYLPLQNHNVAYVNWPLSFRLAKLWRRIILDKDMPEVAIYHVFIHSWWINTDFIFKKTLIN